MFIERGVVQLPYSLQEHISTVQQMFRRYNNAPASLADASLITLSELIDPCQLLTLARDFTVYRRHGRKLIPVICPE